jgi:hypothetical protein
MCSIGARGLWMEMMCIMHEGEPYGHLLVSGDPFRKSNVYGPIGAPTRQKKRSEFSPKPTANAIGVASR